MVMQPTWYIFITITYIHVKNYTRLFFITITVNYWYQLEVEVHETSFFDAISHHICYYANYVLSKKYFKMYPETLSA